MGAIRLLGTPTKMTASRQIVPTVSVSSPATTLNSSDSAYLTIGAVNNVYQPLHYFNKVLRQWRQWLFNAMGPDPNVAPPASADLVPLTGTISLSETAGGTRFVVTLAGLNSTPSSTISSVTLDNTSGWATPLGLVEDGVSKVFNASGGTVTFTGDFQPRTIWTFPDTTVDSGDYRVKGLEITNIDGDGTPYFVDIGGYFYRRDFGIVDLSSDFGGPSFPVALFSAWGGTRKSITIHLPDETVFTGMGGAFERIEDIAVGDWITIGNINWCSRVKTASGSTITLWEPFPSNVTANAGDEIRVISEAAAFEIEMKRLSMCHIWDMDDANGVPYYGRFGTYAPYSTGETEEVNERRSLDDPLYNKALSLVRYAKNPLTLP